MAESRQQSAGSQKSYEPAPSYVAPASYQVPRKDGGFKPLQAANSTIHEFASSTTIHGISYVFDRAIKAIDHVLWLLVVCFGAGVAVYMSLDAWNTWKEAPVLTSVSSTGLPLRKIDFPAITICSQGLIQVRI